MLLLFLLVFKNKELNFFLDNIYKAAESKWQTKLRFSVWWKTEGMADNWIHDFYSFLSSSIRIKIERLFGDVTIPGIDSQQRIDSWAPLIFTNSGSAACSLNSLFQILKLRFHGQWVTLFHTSYSVPNSVPTRFLTPIYCSKILFVRERCLSDNATVANLACWGCIKRKTRFMGPCAGVDYNSPNLTANSAVSCPSPLQRERGRVRKISPIGWAHLYLSANIQNQFFMYAEVQRRGK